MIEKEMAEITLLLFLSLASVPEALFSAEDGHPLLEPLLLQCSTHLDPSVDVTG